MKIIDLFAGCGGMSLGFQNEKFEIIEAHDNWEIAVNCYSVNFQHPVYKTDLGDYQKVTPMLMEKSADLIIGGPPCQEFSSAGKRKEGARADLTAIFGSIVASIKPKYFVMENVARCAKSIAYGEARKSLLDAGYGLTEIVLNAALCGVPQRRKRFFVVGGIGQQMNFLDEIVHTNLAKKEMTLHDYFGDDLNFEYYYRHPRNYNRRGIFSIHEPSPTIRGVNRPIPMGYTGHPADPTKKFKELRPLTTRERSEVQTFPPGFIFPNSKTQSEQLIGNAVPVNQARFVAKCLRQHLEA